MLDLTTNQLELSELIHDHVAHYPDDDAGLELLLPTVPAYVDAFFYLIDNSTEVQRDYLCQQYCGLNRFTQLMQNLAELYIDGELDDQINKKAQ